MSNMLKKTNRTTGWLAVAVLSALLPAAPCWAVMYGFGGADDPSLHGATGSLEVVEQDGHFVATWSMNFDGYQGDRSHQYLTNVAFKAFDGVSSASVLDGASYGGLYPSSNVNNGGCDTNGSPAGFLCLDLSGVRATHGGTYSVSFLVDGTLSNEWSYRGKFGTGNGWVISESCNAIPEPSAALLFAIGAVTFGSTRRKHA